MSDVDEGFTDWCGTPEIRLAQQRLWVRYRIRLDQGTPDREVEWRDEAYAHPEPDDAPEPVWRYWAKLAGAVLVIGILISLVSMVRAETCKAKIDNTVDRLSGYRWQWRTVDGRQCWYYSNRLLPREDLVWSFSEDEFNSDIDRVIKRQFYHLDLDENGLLRPKDSE